MIQIKIIRNQTKLIERDVNQWIQDLNTVDGYEFRIVDIKYHPVRDDAIDTVMIIYEITQKPYHST